MRFLNRQDAGRKLAQALSTYRGDDVVVYALPRGGVPVGIEVAKELDAPFDLLITSKVGHPLNPEYAVCAITDTGDLLCDEKERVTIDAAWLNGAVREANQKAALRRKIYLGDRKHVSSKDKVAIVVDDGAATGLTMRVALRSIRKEKPQKLIAAIPVAPFRTIDTLKEKADEIITLDDSDFLLGAVGSYYADFKQLSDKEVIKMMKQYDRKTKMSRV